MTDNIEIKAMGIEEARKRALKVLDIESNQILAIKEKIKSSSIFGLFKKEGLYEIEYTNEKITEIKEEKKVISKPLVAEATSVNERHTSRDLRKERTVKQTAPKVAEKKEKLFKEEIDYSKENFKSRLEVKTSQDIELDQEKLDKIINQSKEIIKRMGLNLEVSYTGISGKNYNINLSGEDKGIIIGKKGKTLNSFEYLLNSLIKDARIDVDVEGFKEKRNETLIELANKMAIKAIKTRKVIRLNPMPPRERKIIHEIINQYPELDTYSEGRDPKRYIIIKRKR